jgi:hypothetical protein
MRRTSLSVSAAICLLVLSGCGSPFFISEQDLYALLHGKEILYAAQSNSIGAYEITSTQRWSSPPVSSGDSGSNPTGAAGPFPDSRRP